MLNPEIAKEAVVSFLDGKELLPRAPSRKNLGRWAHEGLKNPQSGKTVTLEYCFIGGEPCTSVEAFHRFIRAHNEEKPSK